MAENLDAIIAAGWSPNSLAAALGSPDKNIIEPFEKQEDMRIFAIKAAGWSPDGLLAALSTQSPENHLLESEVKSPEKDGGIHIESKCSFESPIQMLTRTFGTFLFDRYDSNSKSTPQPRYIDKKTTPSPSRFIDLTMDCDKTISNRPFPYGKFQTAKSFLFAQKENMPSDTKSAKIVHLESKNSSLPEIPIDSLKLDIPLPNGWVLFVHQREAIMQAIISRRCILAFDMGLGKTIISIKWAEILCANYEDCICVVIAPVTLLETWRREAEMVGFLVITDENHDRSGTSPTLLLSSWAKVPSPEQMLRLGKLYLVIGDESHAMQTITSQRTRAILALCQHKACAGCILATGTPMKNGRPCNLLPLLIAIRHPIANNRIEFEKRYCNARRTRYCAWDITGATNLTELRDKVGGFLMRKTKVI
jgi:SNF2 family DNA or RNA helicase